MRWYIINYEDVNGARVFAAIEAGNEEHAISKFQQFMVREGHGRREVLSIKFLRRGYVHCFGLQESP